MADRGYGLIKENSSAASKGIERRRKTNWNPPFLPFACHHIRLDHGHQVIGALRVKSD